RSPPGPWSSPPRTPCMSPTPAAMARSRSRSMVARSAPWTREPRRRSPTGRRPAASPSYRAPASTTGSGSSSATSPYSRVDADRVAGAARAAPSAARATQGAVLRELRIENLLLIERAELRLGPGLNAITGETGAGKTVLAHSLDLLMGGKAKKGIVRPGAAEAWVEGVFDLPPGLLAEPELAEPAERLPEGAEEIVLGRRVSASGRTSAFVAGRAATAADLRLLGGRLLAFYG